MKKNYLFIVLLMWGIITLNAQVTAPFIVDFEQHSTGPYTMSMAKQDFPHPGDWYYGMDQGRGEIMNENGNKVLRVKYPRGCVGVNDPGACGIQIKWKLPEPAKTMWLSYRIKFEEGFEFVKGGKLPGLCGGKCYTGGKTPECGDGWSARIMWRTGGKVVQYMYFTDQAATYGDDMKWNEGGAQRQFIPGRWHTVLTQVVLNDVPVGASQGLKNGIVRSWFDGELAMEVDTLRLVDSANQKIDLFYISTFYGGSDSSWAPSKDNYIRYDDFWISSTPPSGFRSSRNLDSSTGMREESLIIQSNPSVNELNIQTDKGITQVEIVNLMGASVIKSLENVVNVDGLGKGIYLIYVKFKDGTCATRKFVKS